MEWFLALFSGSRWGLTPAQPVSCIRVFFVLLRMVKGVPAQDARPISGSRWRSVLESEVVATTQFNAADMSLTSNGRCVWGRGSLDLSVSTRGDRWLRNPVAADANVLTFPPPPSLPPSSSLSPPLPHAMHFFFVPARMAVTLLQATWSKNSRRSSGPTSPRGMCPHEWLW